MTPVDMAALEVQRATLLDVLQALAEFGRKRAERRAAAGQHDNDRAGGHEVSDQLVTRQARDRA